MYYAKEDVPVVNLDGRDITYETVKSGEILVRLEENYFYRVNKGSIGSFFSEFFVSDILEKLEKI